MSKAGKKSFKSSSPTSSDSNKKVPIYRYKNVDFQNMDISDLKKGEGQPICYLNYKDEKHGETKLLVQTGEIKITDGGVPGKHPKYYPTDDKREFIKVPLDDSQPACVELRKHLERADEYFGSDSVRMQVFGKKAGSYQYQPLIRTPQEQDNDDEDNKKKGDKEKKPRHDFVKLKFNMVGSEENRANKTKLLELNNGKKEPVKADTITEIYNHIKFLSEVKIIFYYAKLWANTSKAQGASKILYGVGLKAMVIQFTPNKGKGIDMDTLEFDETDDDNDDENNNVSPKKSPSKSKSKLDDDDDDDDDNDDDNNEDDNEEDEEPEVKQDKKSSKKKVVEEDNEDEEEEEQPKSKKKDDKKSKKPVKKSSKKVESEDDEEEEEEEVKPKKRTSKNKSPSKSK
ncbi:hypothetical protein ma307 [Moumouvirus australiensis]|uniref:Uncharacterized protein n=1 Tax=Moumouvirus australiensis TaxID=2109587 RepID=A0A2P1ELC6_9VIRU|nr:hypothetical protein QKC55_gp597 [Moumouvirus australiensis]AVL94693.1 hypothetical protein ma307 [Moumouvirus australiensis]